MIGWGQILYGAALSALLSAGALVAVARPRRLSVILLGAAGSAAGPMTWNAILRAAHGEQFFTDAPLPVLPASWQDIGSGVFTLAVCTLLFGLGPLVNQPARRTVGLALACGLAAFLVDVYLY